MPSRYATVCDAIVSDLQTNVAALAVSAITGVQKYYRFQSLEASAGEKWLGVWPAGVQFDPLVTGPGGSLVNVTYQVVYWEDASASISRGVRDEPSAFTMGELHEAMWVRLFNIANVRLGGTLDTRSQRGEPPTKFGDILYCTLEISGRDDVYGA